MSLHTQARRELQLLPLEAQGMGQIELESQLDRGRVNLADHQSSTMVLQVRALTVHNEVPLLKLEVLLTIVLGHEKAPADDLFLGEQVVRREVRSC